jgi:hypothetical protein
MVCRKPMVCCRFPVHHPNKDENNFFFGPDLVLMGETFNKTLDLMGKNLKKPWNRMVKPWFQAPPRHCGNGDAVGSGPPQPALGHAEPQR